MQYANAIVVLVYLTAMVALGVYLKRFVNREADFFVAGRRLNKWIIAGTIMATNTAAISLVGPARYAYEGGGVSLLLIAWSGNVIAAISALVFVPRLRRLRLTTVTSLLEERYGPALRLVPSAMWMVYYALFSGNAIYTLATVLEPVVKPFFPGMGVDALVALVIVTVGGVVIVYSAFSGSVGVAYTATIQAGLIILGGVILLPLSLKAVGGISGFVEKVPAEAFVFWKSEGRASWKFIVMVVLMGLPYWCTSQNMLQRTFAGKSVREASRGLLLAALLAGPITVSYIIPGMCASVLYADEPSLRENPDLVLPHMIVNLLPVGFAGLFVAGLLAASNSTASALLNSVATLGENDFYRRFFPGQTTRQYLWAARIITIAAGGVGLIYAFNVKRLGGILDANFAIVGVFEPPIFVMVAAGIFGRRVNAWGAISAVIAGMAFTTVTWVTGALDMVSRNIWAFPVTVIALIAGSMIGAAVDPISQEARAKRDALLERMKDREAGRRIFTWPRARLAASGYAVAIIAFVALIWFSFFEEVLPGPVAVRIFWYLGLVTTFVLGCLFAVPLFMSGAVEEGYKEEEAAEAGSLRASMIHRIVGNGWFYLALYAVAAVLVAVLYWV